MADLAPDRYWENSLTSGRLEYQHCLSCDAPFHRPRLVCPVDGSRDWEWRPAHGNGSVYSVTSVVRPARQHREDAPFQVALVELDEGVRVLARIEGETVEIGDRVSFQPAASRPDLLVFRRVA